MRGADAASNRNGHGVPEDCEQVCNTKLQEQIFECRESDSPKGEAQDAPNQADRFLRKVSTYL